MARLPIITAPDPRLKIKARPVPAVDDKVTGPAASRLCYLDYQNEIREIEASGLLAMCLQHEIDHLDGVLFVDHISSLKRGMILRKLAKTKRSRAPATTA